MNILKFYFLYIYSRFCEIRAFNAYCERRKTKAGNVFSAKVYLNARIHEEIKEYFTEIRLIHFACSNSFIWASIFFNDCTRPSKCLGNDDSRLPVGRRQVAIFLLLCLFRDEKVSQVFSHRGKRKLLFDICKRTMSSVQIQNGTGLEQQVIFYILITTKHDRLRILCLNFMCLVQLFCFSLLVWTWSKAATLSLLEEGKNHVIICCGYIC